MMNQAPQQYDVSNTDTSPSAEVRVIAVDTRQDALKVLKIVVEGLAVHADVGLWLAPYAGISMVPRMSPFDLIYLDEKQQVSGISVILPGTNPNPPKGSVASALVLPLHSKSLLRLDLGVALHFSPVPEEVEEIEEASRHTAPAPQPEARPIAAASATDERVGAATSQSIPAGPATQNAPASHQQRPLTVDELRIVETLKSYLVGPLAALESAERFEPPEPETIVPAATAPDPAVESASAPEAEEIPQAQTPRRTKPRRMRRPRVPFSARSQPAPLQENPAEQAAPERHGSNAAVPAEQDSLPAADAPLAADLKGLPADKAQPTTGGQVKQVKKDAGTARSGKAEVAPPQQAPDEVPRGKEKKQSTDAPAAAPETRPDSKFAEKIAAALQTNAGKGWENRHPATNPAPPVSRSKRPPAGPNDEEGPARRPAPAIPDRQRLSIEPFHVMKKPAPPPPPAQPGVLTRLLRHVYTGSRGITNRRTALRKAVPGLVAFPWGRPDSPAYCVENLSSTGLYLVTEERWPRGAVISLALQRSGARESRHAHRVLVEAGTIRLGANGLGLMFVLPSPEDIRLWEELPDSPWFSAGPETVVREFRAARALTFLRRICPGGYEEFRNLMQKEFSFLRISNAVDIAFMAEEIVVRDPGAFKYRAHPRLILEILTLGSWADSVAVQELWAGLLATGCTTDGHEVLNLTFAGRISQFTPVHAQLLTAICAGALLAGEKRNGEETLETYSTIQKIMETTGIRNALKIHHTIQQLCDFGLLEMQSGHSWAGEIAQFRANPTMLGLEFYRRCARIDSQAHLLQFR